MSRPQAALLETLLADPDISQLDANRLKLVIDSGLERLKLPRIYFGIIVLFLPLTSSSYSHVLPSPDVLAGLLAGCLLIVAGRVIATWNSDSYYILDNHQEELSYRRKNLRERIFQVAAYRQIAVVTVDSRELGKL